MSDKIKIILYKVVKRFLTWFGDLMLATKPPKTSAEQILTMLQVIQSGDIICRKYSYYMDSYFIPGEFTHSGLVIDKDQMIHSVAEGVQIIHPIDFIKDADSFVVLRPHYPEGRTTEATLRAKKHLMNHTEYDFLFNDPDKFYCHEFVADCLRAAGVGVRANAVILGIKPFRFMKTVYLAEGLIKVSDTVYLF